MDSGENQTDKLFFPMRRRFTVSGTPGERGNCLPGCRRRQKKKGMSEKELLAVYFAEDGSVTDPGQLAVEALYAKRYQPQAYARICGYLSAVWDDLERFPVGTVASDGNAGVSFADSWMQSRNFGGERGHEGCDIMASVNERGIYPIYSVSDGVVENVGWLRLGGYRIGIRSPSGAYFYYAHLAEYAKEFEVGGDSPCRHPSGLYGGYRLQRYSGNHRQLSGASALLESISTMRTGRNFP